MLYTPLTRKALAIASAAHQGQADRAGVPYIVHPVIVAEGVEGEKEVCAALLHDVVEDSEWTLEDLEREGIPADVIEVLSLLTHRPGVSYGEYVAALRGNPIARAVKLSDLKHNMDLGRLEKVSERDVARAEKYRAAREMLLAD